MSLWDVNDSATASLMEQKLELMCERVSGAADPMVAWNEILAELEQLAVYESSGTEPLPTTPILDACGVAPTEKKRLAAGLDSGKWIELSVSELEFNPVFEYCTNKETSEYIQFTDASAGYSAPDGIAQPAGRTSNYRPA